MFESLGHPDRIKALAEYSSPLDSFLVFIPIIDSLNVFHTKAIFFKINIHIYTRIIMWISKT